MTDQVEHRESSGIAGGTNRRQWLQLGTSAAAWLALGLADIFITWRACLDEEQFGSASIHPAAHLLYLLVTAFLFLVALSTGVSSYRTWRKLSAASGFIQAEGRERDEFMSQAGVYISFVLGFGMLWLSLPLFLIQMCLRTR